MCRRTGFIICSYFIYGINTDSTYASHISFLYCLQLMKQIKKQYTAISFHKSFSCKRPVSAHRLPLCLRKHCGLFSAVWEKRNRPAAPFQLPGRNGSAQRRKMISVFYFISPVSTFLYTANAAGIAYVFLASSISTNRSPESSFVRSSTRI